MQIDKSVRAVERLFSEVDKSTQNFFKNVSLKCPTGCTKCCHGQKVAAAPLEFLPYAYSLYKEGKLEEQYWNLKTRSSASGCFLIEGDDPNGPGRCSAYAYRGMICRLFGSSASIHKNGTKIYSGCSILKSQIDEVSKFDSALQKYAPVYSDFYMKLRAIDNEYGAMMFPINLAILKSMELVYYTTRRKRKRSV